MMRIPVIEQTLALVLITILLLVMNITLAEPVSLSVTLGIHPNRWNMPSPLEIKGTFTEQATFDGPFTLTLSSAISSPTENIPITGSTEGCYAILDHGETVLVTRTMTAGQNSLSIRFRDGASLTSLYIRCQEVVFERPSSVDPATERTTTTLFIESDYHSQPWGSSVDIVQHPTILHEYQWQSSTGAIVAVTFSFYRPSTMSDVADFYIDHPLLQVRRITSTHLSSDDMDVEDLQRPYHLLTREDYTEGIRCHATGVSSQIFFQRDPVSDEILVLASVPTPATGASPDQPYICTFTIPYPADVIYASMYSVEDEQELKVSIREVESQLSYPNIPLGIPPVIPYSSTAVAPPGVLVWHSPHHLHNDMMEFDLAIATTSLYYGNTDKDKLHIISSPQTEMILNIESPALSPTYLPDWEPTIRCHLHNSPSRETTTYDNGIFDLTQTSFQGLGQVCRITLHRRPEGHPPDAHHHTSIQLGFRHNGSTVFNLLGITIIDAFHRFRQVSRWFTLQDTSYVKPDMVTWARTSIPLTTYDDTSTRKTYIRATMNLQYLLSYQTRMNSQMFSLHLAFNKGSELLQVGDGRTTITARAIIQHGSSFNIATVALRSSHVNFWNTLPGTPEDHEFITRPTTTTAFHRGRPLRAPHLTMDVPSDVPLLDSSQPLRITLEWELPTSVSPDNIDNIAVYPFLSSSVDDLTMTFSPLYARITSVRATPLTGYSYRCVEWNQMAAPYVYEGTEPLTTDNSFVCPSYTQGESINLTHWRRVQPNYPNDNTTKCFYELAAVCVTPSKTEEGVYNAHPLADCPSFLGATHSIPCSLVEGNEPPASSYKIDHLEAEISPPELIEEGTDDVYHNSRSVTLWWTYSNDPRLTLTAAIKPLLGESGNGSDDTSTTKGWITLARDIPAYLSPKQPDDEGVTIGFPLLNPDVKNVIIRLSLNGVPGVEATFKIKHTMAEDQWGGYPTGCSANANKLFDEGTHLCRCQDGFTSSAPIGLENPMVQPSEFICEAKPSDDVPSTSEQCHTIPPGVTPPYFTRDCGYGFAKNTNGKCEDCECFSAWTKGTNSDDGDNTNGDNDDKKCERCVLMDVCVVENTADITFKQPEYCHVRRCLCKHGYSGDKCQYTVMYGTLTYHDVATDGQKASLIDATKEKPVIVPRRQITTFQPRVTNNVKISLGDTPVEAFVQQATQVLSEDRKEVITSIMVALGRLADADTETSPFIMAVSPFTPAGETNSAASDLGDLHYAWEQLQNNYQDRPVYKDDDYGTLNGGVGSAYDPHCVPNAYTYCPDGKKDDLLPPESQVDEDELKDVYEEEGSNGPIIDDDDDNSSSNTTTYIIIGVVLGVVLILFIALIVSILYCRKHEKMCFRKRKTKGSAADDGRSVELASSNNSKSNTKTPSSAAPPPSSTMSTSSYLPTQVQVEDPTLPADWIALEDKSTGRVYYSNKVTMESSWDHPAQPKEKPRSAYGW